MIIPAKSPATVASFTLAEKGTLLAGDNVTGSYVVAVPIGKIVIVGDAAGVIISFPTPLVTTYFVGVLLMALAVRLNAPNVRLLTDKLRVPVTSKEPVRLIL